MNIFKKTMKELQTIESAIEACKSNSTPIPTPEPEEWVWVEGYKGTDMNMRCKGYQYELNKQYDMPQGEVIEECHSGFHLCLKLRDVFGYYNIGCGNRFFKVLALVRKSDQDKYGTSQFADAGDGLKYYVGDHNKLVAKSIMFISELPIDEILKGTEVAKFSEQYKHLAIATDIENALKQYKIDTLIKDGYSMPFASYIVKAKKFEIAHAVGSQKDLSMDMRVLAIMELKY